MPEIIKEGYTRVSEVASAYANYSAVNPMVLENARLRGEHMHKLIYNRMNDLPVRDEDMFWDGKPVAGYLASFDKFWDDFSDGAELLIQEKRLYDDDLKLTGKPDLLIKHKGRCYIMDWKFTYANGLHWAIQAAGYLHLYKYGYIEDESIDIKKYQVSDIVFVRLDKNGRDPDKLDYTCDASLFYRAYELYNRFLKGRPHNMEKE